VRPTGRYVVTDIDPEHLARLASRFQHRPNVQIRFADLSQAENFKEFSGQLESVVCLNVLEHIEDDLAGLRNIHSALCPGGRAIILVPQGQEIFGTLDAALGITAAIPRPSFGIGWSKLDLRWSR